MISRLSRALWEGESQKIVRQEHWQEAELTFLRACHMQRGMEVFPCLSCIHRYFVMGVVISQHYIHVQSIVFYHAGYHGWWRWMGCRTEETHWPAERPRKVYCKVQIIKRTWSFCNSFNGVTVIAILLGERNNGSIIASVSPAPVAALTTTCLDASKEMRHLSWNNFGRMVPFVRKNRLRQRHQQCSGVGGYLHQEKRFSSI